MEAVSCHHPKAEERPITLAISLDTEVIERTLNFSNVAIVPSSTVTLISSGYQLVSMAWIAFTSAKVDSLDGRDDSYRCEDDFSRCKGDFYRLEGDFYRLEGGFYRCEGDFYRREGEFSPREGGFHGLKNQCFSPKSPILALLFNPTPEVKLMPWNLAVESALGSLPPP